MSHAFFLSAAVLTLAAAANHGCATLSDIAAIMTNQQRLKFQVASVNGFTVAEIGIAQKQQMANFPY